MNYGQKFKLLRKAKGFALKQLADETISISAISRFENGKADLGLQTLDRILTKMHSSLMEFMEQHPTRTSRDVSTNIYSLVGNMQVERNVSGLQDLFQTVHAEYLQNSQLETLVHLAVIATALYSLTGKNVMRAKEIDRIYNSVFDVEVWDSDTLTVLGSIAVLLDPPRLEIVFNDLVSNAPTIMRQDFIAAGDLWDNMLNCYEIALGRDVEIATRMHAKLSQLAVPYLALDYQIRIYFLNQLFAGLTGKDELERLTAKKNVFAIIGLLIDVGNPLVARQYADIADGVLEGN
ncbi:helix-turn-helix domain-containing protein [Lacticaseibacillus sharpeae]|nr:helix-turn-helix transcriptional regulator [Lacticaseibacillus sharpeae]